MSAPLIALDHLSLRYTLADGSKLNAVDDLTLHIPAGRTVGLIGESGSGKSSVARMLLGLAPPTAGTIAFEGVRVDPKDKSSAAALRANMGAVFQEPFESLNPRMVVSQIVAEPLVINSPGLTRRQRHERVLDALELVGLNRALADRYPRALSGGQQQRVGIARAIINRPTLVVLDEPTSSLDLSSRAQILNLLADLKTELKMTYLFISHDMDTVAHICDEIYVMYMGRLVERAEVDAVLDGPVHPYTRSLVSSRMTLEHGSSLPVFELGPNVSRRSSHRQGCILTDRCPFALDSCHTAEVSLEPVGQDHHVACIRAHDPALNSNVGPLHHQL